MPAYGHFNPNLALDPSSLIQKGASVSVRLPGTATVATIYSDRTGTAKANPFITDAITGNFDFWAAPGDYDLLINGTTLRITVHSDPAANPAGDFYVGAPAAGAASGKDKAAVLAAIDAAKAVTRGGVVQFGPGLYKVGDLAILAPEFNATQKQLTLRGAGGNKATYLWFDTDRAAGTYAVDEGGTTSPNNGVYKTVIEDIAFIGPTGARGTIGTVPCNLSAIRLSTHTSVYRCSINYFHTAINSNGNHSVVRDTSANNNYYGVLFSATAGAGGDIVLDNVSRDGNLMASDAITPTGVAAYHNIKGHLGFGPYCIYFEPGRTVGLLGMLGCVFDGTSFELMGNGFMHSPSQQAFVSELRFRSCGNWTENNATYGLPATPYHASNIFLHSLTKFSFEDTSPDASRTLIDVTTSAISGTIDGSRAGIAGCLGASVPYIKAPIASQAAVKLRDINNFRAEAVGADSSAAIVADRLVEWTAFHTVRPHGQWGTGARTPIAGVAMNGVPASSTTMVIIAQEGININIDLDGAEPTNTQVLVPSSTTASKVMASSWDGTTATVTRPIVGQLGLAGGPAGKVIARVKIP